MVLRVVWSREGWGSGARIAQGVRHLIVVAFCVWWTRGHDVLVVVADDLPSHLDGPRSSLGGLGCSSHSRTR